jgi:hypothetical protein
MYSLSDSAFTCGSMLLQREAYSPRARHTRLQQHRLQQLQQRCNRIETHLKALSEGRTRLQQLQQLQRLLQSEAHSPATASPAARRTRLRQHRLQQLQQLQQLLQSEAHSPAAKQEALDK